MAEDYSVPVLEGEGETDYERYLRTDVLLSLQRKPDEVIHRDELLFQTVHQSTELWLKLATFEIAESATQIRAGGIDTSVRLLTRASLGIELVTGQLEMLRYISPWDFQTIRTVLGHGSGFESPGWHTIHQASRELEKAFQDLIASREIDLVQVYKGDPGTPTYRLAEAMIEFDERVSLWRVRHYKVVTRIIGHQVIGTGGTPVDVLAGLLGHKIFPELWRVRTRLTETGPMGDRDER